MISIVITAYNIARYLPKALESILNQEVAWNVEILVGEDFSKDNTLEIALDYQEKFPGTIKVLTTDRNLGLTPNFSRTINGCKGKYIALCDGDDYWTDPLKLVNQLNILEQEPSYTGCAHQAEIFFEDQSQPNRFFGPIANQIYRVEDLIGHRHFHTSSLMFRKAAWDKAGGIPTNIISNERALYPILAIYGPIFYSNRCMCVYFFNTSSLSSRISIHDLSNDLNMIPFIKKLNANFPLNKFRSFLHLTAFTYTKKHTLFKTLYHYICFVFFSFSYFPKNLGDVKYGTQKCVQIIFKIK